VTYDPIQRTCDPRPGRHPEVQRELSSAEGGEGDRVSEGLMGKPEPRGSIFGFRQGINGGQEDYPLIGWRPLTVECLPQISMTWFLRASLVSDS
jgi:hypothetical protein